MPMPQQLGPQYSSQMPQQQYNQQQYGQYNPAMFQSFQPQQQGSWLSRFFGGTNDSFQNTPKYTPQGYDLLSQLMSGGLNQINNPYQGFEGIEQYAQDQFRRLIPGLAEQFSGMGGSPGGSSGFAGRLGEASTGLAGLLAQQKSQYGMQNRQQGLQQAQLGLTDPFNTAHLQGQPGLLEQLIGNFNQNARGAAKTAAGAFMGA